MTALHPGPDPAAVGPGDSGDAVLDVQARLQAAGLPIAAGERGWYGPETESAVKAFQVQRGLLPDGVVGQVTWRELWEAGQRLGSRMLYVRFPPMRGDDVRDMQARLNALGFDAGTEDGIYTSRVEAAVREFQRNVALPSDGVVARNTVEALDGLRRQIRPGSKAQLRERLEREFAGLRGRVVFLDPAHGARDVGRVTAAGVPEAWAVYRVAQTTSAVLGQAGAQGVLSRSLHRCTDGPARLHAANAAKATVALSFHLACRPEPAPSVAFYARAGSQSEMGRELAVSVASALHPHLGRPPAVIGRNLAFLRDTAMPAAVVDLGCPDNERLLGEDPYLTDLGSAVAEGVRAYFERV